MFRTSIGGPEQGLVPNLRIIRYQCRERDSVDGREREALVVAVMTFEKKNRRTSN